MLGTILLVLCAFFLIRVLISGFKIYSLFRKASRNASQAFHQEDNVKDFSQDSATISRSEQGKRRLQNMKKEAEDADFVNESSSDSSRAN